MDEGIDYLPTGAIVVKFDGQEYRLSRPKLGTLRWFDERIHGIRTEYLGRLDKLRDLVAQLEGDLSKQKRAAVEKQAEELRAATNEPFWESTKLWIAEAFKQLGDRELPDFDDWPAWLATDTSIVAGIIGHWKTAPKASGPTPPQ